MTPQQKKWLDTNPTHEIIGPGGLGMGSTEPHGEASGRRTQGRYRDVLTLMPDGTTRKGAPPPNSGGFSVGVRLKPGETIFSGQPRPSGPFRR